MWGGAASARRVTGRTVRCIALLAGSIAQLLGALRACRRAPFTFDRTPLLTFQEEPKSKPVAIEPQLEATSNPFQLGPRSRGVARGTANPEFGTATRA